MIDGLRAYDNAMVNFAKQLYRPDANVSFVSPQKSISFVTRKQRGTHRNKIVEFPMIAIQRVGYPEYSMERDLGGREGNFHRKWIVSEDRKEAINVQKFVPVILTYQVDFYIEQGKYSFMNEILLRLMQLFNRGDYLYIDLTYGEQPFGEGLARIVFGGLTDTSELEGGTDFERTLRSSATFTVDAWLPRGYETVKTVQTTEIITGLFGNNEKELVEVMSIGDESTRLFEIKLLCFPIIPGTFLLEFSTPSTIVGKGKVGSRAATQSYDPTRSALDYSVGLVTGTGIESGYIDYRYGDVKLLFLEAPASDTEIVLSYKCENPYCCEPKLVCPDHKVTITDSGNFSDNFVIQTMTAQTDDGTGNDSIASPTGPICSQ